ncbi:PspA/IM30 family protein [Phreatobacter stygius]|uniref:PspA/IM30 family protein n=1 Tax=Phreatobacter stygius TaxID=1940610 RepID=A0A4D7B1W6_9HYPH|nr:PspA/IM30 family protein [Phreatobacter stygius]QCI64688.1 PspA/IM30 family protein [Phreatobacter stygius]
MFKAMMTLIRGQKASKALAARRALSLLDQQKRDAAISLDLAQRALAAAIASDQAQAKRIVTIERRIAGLEIRATAALQSGRAALASQVAATIAALEAVRMSGCEAHKAFAMEIGRLKRDVAAAEGRLADWERDRRIARATETVRHLRNGPAGPATDNALAEAEATLARLHARQAESEAAASARDALNNAALSTNIAGVLAAAGFGAKPRPSADDVLIRLKTKAAAVRMAG